MRSLAPLVIALACLADATPSAAAEAVSAPRRVLIAAETSPFKDRVATLVADVLRRDGLDVAQIPLDQLACDPSGDYQAVVLLNTCHAWRPSRKVRKFLKTCGADQHRKLVVVTTASSGKCDLRTEGVDAISSASKRSQAPGVAQAVLDRLRDHLGAEP